MSALDYSLREVKQVVYRPAGSGRLFTDPDVDHARIYFKSKSRKKVDKTTSVGAAVKELISDGDYIIGRE